MLAFLIGLAASAVHAAETLTVDAERNELRLAAHVQRNDDRPTHSQWGKKSTGFVGVRGGDVEVDFVILAEADRAEIYRAAVEKLGWKTGRRFSWLQTYSRRGLSRRTKVGDYMTGDPLLCALEFERDGRTERIPLEDAIRARTSIEGAWVEVPYTPHFVFTGAGEENGIESGCLVCPSDCVGGLMTDNSLPVQTEAQEFLVNWSKLPSPGAAVTVILRSIR